MVKFRRFLLAFFLLFYTAFASEAVSSGVALSLNASRANELLAAQNNIADTRGWLDIEKISEILRKNKLFDTAFFSSPTLNLKFQSDSDASPAILIKGVELSLKTIGAQLVSISEVSNLSPKIYGGVVAKSAGIDPSQLANALRMNKIGITKILRDKGGLVFWLDLSEANLQGDDAKAGDEIALGRLGAAYFINLNGAKSLQFVSNEQNLWIPLVRVYDKNLAQLKKFEEDSVKKEYLINLPDGAKYALINDSIDINNIKNELIIKLIK